MVWVAKAQLATLTDVLMRAYIVTASATRAALDARYVRPADVDVKVAAAVAAAPTVTAAAEVAVSDAMASQHLSWTLVQGGPDATTLATVRGTPTFAAGKFGNCMTGGVLNYASMAGAQTGDYTIEFWYKATTTPVAAVTLVQTPFGNVGLNAGGATLNWNGTGAGAAPNLANGSWHHIAMVVSVNPGLARFLRGIYYDGALVLAPSEVGAAGWGGTIAVGGFTTTGTDWLAGSYDEVRLSFKANSYTAGGSNARYTSAFTPPVAPFTWDADTLVLAHLNSAAATVKASAYPARPAGAPGGAVLYVGTSTPTGMLTRDRWINA